MSKRLTALMAATIVGFASPTAAASLDLGVAWFGKSGMSATMLASARERLEETGVDVNWDIEAELNDVDALADRLQRFENDGKDGLIVFRSLGASYLADHPPSSPTFIGAVNHPELLGVIENMERPEGNITGVTHYIPRKILIEGFLSLAPSVKSFMVLVEDGHSASIIDSEDTLQACNELNINCKIFQVSTENILETASNNIENFDAIITGNQNGVTDNVNALLEVAEKKPIFSYSQRGVRNGALGGVVPDSERMGRLLADMIQDVLVLGSPISEVAVQSDPDPVLMINMSTAQRLGIEPPLELLSIARIIE